MGNSITGLIESIYQFLWGDLITIPLPQGELSLSLLVMILIPAGIYFTIKTNFLPIRMFKDMIQILTEKEQGQNNALSVVQTLIVSTATRRDGKFSWGRCGHLYWRCRSCFLDVDHCTHRFFNCFY